MCWTGAAEANFIRFIGVFGGGPVNTDIRLVFNDALKER
jgi:hypothetical protein